MPSPLPVADPASLGLATRPLEHLDRLIKQHIEEGRYPGAQIAVARHGKLALSRSYGRASTDPQPGSDGRHAVPAVLQHQGAHHGGAVEPDGGRPRLDHRQGRRPHS